jgi:CubicO group peptidase (beta-lactamase class C family)
MLASMQLSLLTGFLLPTCLVGALSQQDVQQAVDRLDDLIQSVLNDTEVPSIAAAVVYNDSIIYANAFGVREVGSNESATPETVYQLASLSKPISSTIVAQLVSNGYLDWSSKTNELDSTIELSDPWITREVTIEDLFSHRSGLFGGGGDDLESFNYNRSEILSRMKYLQPTGSFRITYQYSNYGITMGAVAAAAAAGLSWEEAASRFYERCNMTSTTSENDEFRGESDRASLHVRAGNGTNFSAPYIVAPERNPDPQAPAGGVAANVIDLAQWLRLQLGNGTWNGEEIVSSEALLYTHQPQINRGLDPASNRTAFYGLGWNIDYQPSGRVFIGHAGAFTSGTRSYVRLNIADGIGIVVLSNCWPTGTPDGIAYTFMDWIYQGNQSETTDWVSFWDDLYEQLNEAFVTTDPGFAVTPVHGSAPLKGTDVYAGTYSNDYVGIVQVKGTDNQNLTMEIGGRSLLLTHWDRDVFIMRPVAEHPEHPTTVTFSVGPGGEAQQVLIDVLNGDGGGVLSRETKE